MKTQSPAHKIKKMLFSDPRFWIGASVLLAVFLVCVLGPLFLDFSPDQSDITQRLCPPSSEHLLGCDNNGLDLIKSLIFGGRVSLYIALLTMALSLSLGSALGILSAYIGGKFDTFLMRIVDILLAFPGILLALVLSAILGPSIHNIVIAISATGWIGSARLVRGQVFSLKEQEYVVASQALGASHFRSIRYCIVPALFAPLIVQATFSISGVILVESSLSFLGLGAQNGAPTWGALLSQGKTVLTEAPWLSLAPGLIIVVVVLSSNLLGDSLRDAVDPKLNSR